MKNKDIRQLLESLSSSDIEEIMQKYNNTTPEKEDFVYVAECFASWQTYYESARHFGLYKTTIMIDNEFVNMFRKLDGDDCYDTVNEIMCSDTVLNHLPSRFQYLLYDHMLQHSDFSSENVSEIIDSELMNDWYGSKEFYPDDDLVGEIHFKCYYKESDELGTAYISVYKIEMNKLDKHDKIDLKVRKWITNNTFR